MIINRIIIRIVLHIFHENYLYQNISIKLTITVSTVSKWQNVFIHFLASIKN